MSDLKPLHYRMAGKVNGLECADAYRTFQSEARLDIVVLNSTLRYFPNAKTEDLDAMMCVC